MFQERTTDGNSLDGPVVTIQGFHFGDSSLIPGLEAPWVSRRTVKKKMYNGN